MFRTGGSVEHALDGLNERGALVFRRDGVLHEDEVLVGGADLLSELRVVAVVGLAANEAEVFQVSKDSPDELAVTEPDVPGELVLGGVAPVPLFAGRAVEVAVLAEPHEEHGAV